MITIIVAVDTDGAIGLKGGLPWPRISEDMKFFRKTTTGHTVIMGWNTLKSLGSQPLPNRVNMVVDRDANANHGPDIVVCNDLEKVLSINRHIDDEVFVIGGAVVNNRALPFASKLLITRINGSYEADTFWRPDLSDWKLTESTPVKRDGQLICTFEEYRRSQ